MKDFNKHDLNDWNHCKCKDCNRKKPKKLWK